MCFSGSQYPNTNANPAPYALNQSQGQVKATSTPAGSTPLNSAAAEADTQDKPTAAPTGFAASTLPVMQ